MAKSCASPAPEQTLEFVVSLKLPDEFVAFPHRIITPSWNEKLAGDPP